jgi:Protein of unknown function (DUF935)
MAGRLLRPAPPTPPTGSVEGADLLLRRLTRFPSADHNPTTLGSRINVTYIDTAMRLGLEGLRQPLVDLLGELLDRAPEVANLCSVRAQIVSGAARAIKPPKHAPKRRQRRAEEIARWCEAQLDQAQGTKPGEDFESALGRLAWGECWGVAAEEILWGENCRGETVPTGFQSVHTRRLAYPDGATWSLHVYDQGFDGFLDGSGQRARFLPNSLRIDDFPAKFLVHVPLIRGEYPTREGYGRTLAFYLAVKLATMGALAQSVDLYGIGRSILTYKTGDKPRPAKYEDIVTAVEQVMRMRAGMGNGVLALPDSIVHEFLSALAAGKGKMPHVDIMSYLDRQIAKAILFSAEVTDSDGAGSNAKITAVIDLMRGMFQHGANGLAASVRRAVLQPLVDINFPDDTDLCPILEMKVTSSPALDVFAAAVEKLTKVGAPIDLRSALESVDMRALPEGVPSPAEAADARKAQVQKDLAEATPPPVAPKASGDAPPKA